MPGKMDVPADPRLEASRKSPTRKTRSASSHGTTYSAYNTPSSTASSRDWGSSRRDDCESYIHKLASYYEGTRRTTLVEVKKQRNIALTQTREKVTAFSNPPPPPHTHTHNSSENKIFVIVVTKKFGPI